MSEVTPLDRWLRSLDLAAFTRRIGGVTSLADLDAKLREGGWAAGEDVIEQVTKAYEEYVGDADVARAQLLSLLRAAMHLGIREVLDDEDGGGGR